MKVTLVLALALVGLFAHSALGSPVDGADNYDYEWETYKYDFNKEYSDETLEEIRKSIFKDNMKAINEHNIRFAEGNESYEMGVNEFTDMLDWEVERIIAGNDDDEEILDKDMEMETSEYLESAALPAHVNWTHMGAVTAVRNQGHFNNSWAFAVADSVASRQFITLGKLTELSKQNLIDCCHSKNYRSAHAFYCIKKQKGIEREATYPYRGLSGHCSFNKKNIGAKIESAYHLREHNETKLALLVAQGPVVAVISHQAVRSYKGGVYDNKHCGHNPDLAVLIVGYGHCRHYGDYWILKTPLGTSFGEHGYIRLARNKNNQCGILNRVYFPVIARK